MGDNGEPKIEQVQNKNLTLILCWGFKRLFRGEI